MSKIRDEIDHLKQSGERDQTKTPASGLDPERESADKELLTTERRNKLDALRKAGNPFPNDFRRKDFSLDLHREYGEHSNEMLEAATVAVSVAGRMVLKRVMGKASFATIQDTTGRIQLYIARDVAGEVAYEAFKHYDLGDILGAQGTLFRTRTGELSVRVTALRLLTKSLRPLPEKFHGLSDQEQKYRQRYLDLITNEESRKVFVTRSRLIQAIREFLVAHGYLEVETPMMHPIPGGGPRRGLSLPTTMRWTGRCIFALHLNFI